jgi:hypothetical protein
VPQDLLERPPAQAVFTAELSLRDSLDEPSAPDLCPQLHVCVHPSPVLLAGPFRGSLGEGQRADGDVRCCRFR